VTLGLSANKGYQAALEQRVLKDSPVSPDSRDHLEQPVQVVQLDCQVLPAFRELEAIPDCQETQVYQVFRVLLELLAIQECRVQPDLVEIRVTQAVVDHKV